MVALLHFVFLGVSTVLGATCRNPICDTGMATNCGGAAYKGCKWSPQISPSCTQKSSSTCRSKYTSLAACNADAGCQWDSSAKCVRLTDYFDCSASNAAGTCANTNCTMVVPYTCVPKCNVYSSADCEGMTFDRYCDELEREFLNSASCDELGGCKSSDDGCIFDSAYCPTLKTKIGCEGSKFCVWNGNACATKTGKINEDGCQLVGTSCSSKTAPPICVTDTSNPSGGCDMSYLLSGCAVEAKAYCTTPVCDSVGNDCSPRSKGVGCTWESTGTCEAKPTSINCGPATDSCGDGKEALGCVSVSAAAASCDVKDGLDCDSITDQDDCETVGCRWAGTGSNSVFVRAPLFLVAVFVLAILL